MFFMLKCLKRNFNMSSSRFNFFASYVSRKRKVNVIALRMVNRKPKWIKYFNFYNGLSGGNAMVSFYMTEMILVDNPHKNQVGLNFPRISSSHFFLPLIYFHQGQCLISVGGDVVFVSYFSDEWYSSIGALTFGATM